MKYYVGIDIGGTFIKGAVVNGEGETLAYKKVPTECAVSNMRVVENVSALTDELIKTANARREDVVGIGVGVPGIVDTEKGVVICSENLYFQNFPIAEEISKLTGFSVKIANDANAAALGEAKFGAGKRYSDTVMVTLGTGVGGGIIIGGKLFEGNLGAGAELGHMVIKAGGKRCACGRRGCFESYSSARALVRMSKAEARKNPASLLGQVPLSEISGKTPFDLADKDEVAGRVVENYIKMLACGLANIANIFRPEAIIIGGGVSAEGERLLAPLEKEFHKEVFAAELGPRVELIIAERKNDAGYLGAAALIM